MAHRIHTCVPEYAFASANGVFFSFWKQRIPPEATATMFRIMDELLEHRDTLGVLVTGYEGVELPHRDVQASISSGLEARTPRLAHGVAVAIEGAGIGATLGRSISRTITLFSRQGYPSKIFPGPLAGLDWLHANGVDRGVDAATYGEIREQVEQPALSS